MASGERIQLAETKQIMPVEQVYALARQYQQSGHLAAAADLCRQLVEQRPKHADGLHLMGIICHQEGDLIAAMDFIRRAIKVKGTVPLYHSNLGEMCRQAGRLDEAIAAGKRALELQPNLPSTLNNLGIAYFDREDFPAAERYYRRALALDPNFAEAHNNLANVLRQQHKFEEAIPEYARAMELKPGYADAAANLASVLHISGRFEEAMSSCRWALTLNPNQPHAHTGLGILHLLHADLPQGWPEYEWRLLMPESRHVAPPGPAWDGSNPAGRKILIYGEQGFGDALQFCRYLPMLRDLGATVFLRLPQPVVGLIGDSMPGIDVSSSQGLPAYDCHCALVSLPHRFQTRLNTIPNPLGYLRARPETAGKWAARLGSGPELKVGVVWTGNPKHVNNRYRAVAAEALLPLLAIEGTRFFSLQVGGRHGELTKCSNGAVPDFSAELTDYAETAGVIANLDLVVSICTSVSHLAGAMGKPLWMLLNAVPDWRWMLERADNPWYPSARLFRQRKPGEWTDVIERVGAELRAVVAGERGRLTPYLREPAR
ncbi:MAG TPA: tetratricopeptide repeat-containing glycosyltransferase family protein [Stellaceae bacterium]|nr:tetratricopeptide repeat-containing glycosyltransferase family protein [Stellaceae bacterium]